MEISTEPGLWWYLRSRRQWGSSKNLLYLSPSSNIGRLPNNVPGALLSTFKWHSEVSIVSILSDLRRVNPSYPVPGLLWVPGPAEVCSVTLRASLTLSQIQCSWAQQENQLISIKAVKQSAQRVSGCGHCPEGLRRMRALCCTAGTPEHPG